MVKDWVQTYLLRGMPHNMLYILCVRVHHCNTLVLIFFVHCEEGKQRFTTQLYMFSVTKDCPARAGEDTNLPKPRHSCLGYKWPAKSLKGPTPRIWPRFHDLPTQLSSRRQEKSPGGARTRVRSEVRRTLPQSRRSSFSRCMSSHRSWRRPDSSHRETRLLSSQCAGVRPAERFYKPKSHLEKGKHEL